MRYAGLWPRLCAFYVDVVILAPLWVIGYWGLATSKTTALVAVVLLPLGSAVYDLYLIGRWGQTIGKMALKIKVVALDGSNAGYLRALYRECIRSAYAVVSLALTMVTRPSISSAEYDSASFMEKMSLLSPPSLQSVNEWL